jgi:hypothetical protein
LSSGGVANIFYQSCAQIDNNQQVYEAQIQVQKCNSILKAGSHEWQKLKPVTFAANLEIYYQDFFSNLKQNNKKK